MATKGVLLLFYITNTVFWCCQALNIYTQLKPGDMLNFSDQLVSTDQRYALGFSGNYLVINCNTGDELSFHPVWAANRDNPIIENSGFLTLDDVGILKIVHSGGQIELYNSGNSASSSNITAVLENNGNFVLKANTGNRAETLWESFDNPTDALLPGMKLGINRKRNKTWSLTSGLGVKIQTLGGFTMEWDSTEEEIVAKRRGMIFWRSGNLGSGKPFTNRLSYGTYSDYKFDIISDGEEESVTYRLDVDEKTIVEQNVFSRWILMYDGDVVDGEMEMKIVSSDFCDGNTTARGCVKWELPKCRRDGSKYQLRMGNFNLENVTYDLNKSLGFIECRDICWNDCGCTGFLNRGETGCLFYRGAHNFSIVTGNEEPYFHVIIPGPLPPPSRLKWIISALAIVVLAMIVSIFLYLRWKKLKQEDEFLKELLTYDKPNDLNELQNDGDNGPSLQQYNVSVIRAATNSFSVQNKLGEGGFGPVYKGKLADGQEIAVKRLSRTSGQGLIEFKNELIVIAKLQHMNLVRLLGFCIQAEERLLIYEYMPNKSLDSFIFDHSRRELLDWRKRYNIIEGIAQGLTYLHKYSRLRIIHRDLKVSNILLDKDMIPKISDFGMARIFQVTDSKANTNRIVGTFGYMSPEYAMEGIFSVKSDVYSFGVMMLEVISGKRIHSTYDDDRPLNLVGYAWEQWKGERSEGIVDPTMIESASMDEVMRWINIALLCVEHNPFDRPTMAEVLSMLTSEVGLPMPKRPAFYFGTTITTSSVGTTDFVQNCSTNGLTFTDLVPR